MAEAKDNEPVTAKKLLTIDPATKDFTANKVHYNIETHISFERWNRYQELQVEIAYGLSVPEIYKKLQANHELMNAMNFADAVINNRDIMKGISDVGTKQYPAALKLCALFINRDDEDRRWVNEDVINQKIKDWEQEGIDVGSFFQLALTIIPGFMETYKAISQGISS